MNEITRGQINTSMEALERSFAILAKRLDFDKASNTFKSNDRVLISVCQELHVAWEACAAAIDLDILKFPDRTLQRFAE